MILPTAGGPFDVTAEIRAGLYVRYRGVDVQNELALMALWLAKNPASLPLKPLRFVENWLKKSQNKGGAATRKGAVSARGDVGKDALPHRGPYTPPPNNGGTASPSMAAYGQTAAGSSTSHGAVAQPGSHAHRPSPVAGVATPPTAPPLFSVDSNVRLGQARTLADALAPFHALVKKHRSQS